jgi:hypothetical protein
MPGSVDFFASAVTAVDLTRLRTLVEEIRWQCKQGHCVFAFWSRERILRNMWETIIAWLCTIQHVGDVAVNDDSRYAALLWAEVRIMLEVCLYSSPTVRPLFYCSRERLIEADAMVIG